MLKNKLMYFLFQKIFHEIISTIFLMALIMITKINPVYIATGFSSLYFTENHYSEIGNLGQQTALKVLEYK